MPPVNSLDRKKRYHQKAINGCVPCKRKHTRCDLRRPFCYKCILAGEECSYDTPQPRVFPNAQQLHTDPAPTTVIQEFVLEDPLERRGLSLFMDRTRKELAGFTSYTDKFWQTLIPQLSTTEPAFRHLAIAIASRHEMLSTEPSRMSDLEDLTSRQHCICLRLFAELDAGKHAELLLLSCIAFIAFERLNDPTGMEARYLPYVVAGAKILRERRIAATAQPVAFNSNLIDTFIEPMFLQIELMFCLFCQPANIFSEHHESHDNCKPRIPRTFDCIKEARDTFVQICAWRYDESIVQRAWTRTSEAFASVWSLLADWQKTFKTLLRHIATEGSEVKARAETLKQQVCVLTGALLYSTEPSASAEALCYPALADLRTPSKLQIYVRLPSTRRINLTAINGGRMCSPADTEARVLPRAKRVAGDGTVDSVLLEFSR